MNDWIMVLAISGFPLGMFVGYGLGKLFKSPPPVLDEDIARFMNRVVNQEEMEEHQRKVKFRMARNGQKTHRFDSGPNAKITRMRVHTVSRRFKKDQ